MHSEDGQVSIAGRREEVEAFGFKNVHPLIHFGTASDRYAGWIGQIYSEEFRERVSSRKRRLGKQSFEERQVPIESVEEYFDHFSTLELDFTFYQPLLMEDGTASNALSVLRQYAEAAPEDAQFLLKIPQMFSARILRVAGGYAPNPTYLNAAAFEHQFLGPALETAGRSISALIFEQEYQRVQDCPSPKENVAELDHFFAEIPHNVPIHLELRSKHLLTQPYFEWLGSRGLGFILSHWTWLPSLYEQWKLSGERFPAADRQVILRLLTPLKVSYADAYAMTHPFDRIVTEIAQSRQARRMIDDTTAISFRAIEENIRVHLIANNRAYGSAPQLNRAIAHRILDAVEKQAF